MNFILIGGVINGVVRLKFINFILGEFYFHRIVKLTLGLVGLADGLARGISQAQGFGYPENSSLIAGILEISQALNMAVYMNTTTPQPGTTIREPRRLFLSGYGYLVGLGIEGLAIALGQGIGYYMGKHN